MESYLWTIHRYHREHEPPQQAEGRCKKTFI